MDRRHFIAGMSAFAGATTFGTRLRAQDAQAVPDWLGALYRAALDAGERKIIYYPTSPGQEPMLEAFSQAFPEIELQFKYTIASELTAVLDAEIASGQRQIDLAQGGATLQLKLNSEGRAAQWAFPEGSGIPANAGHLDNHLFSLGRSITGVVYNTRRVTEAEVPLTLDGYFAPEWAGRVAIQQPRGSVAVDNSLAILRENGMITEEQIALLAPFPIETGNVAMQTAVAQGKYDIGLWAHGAAFSSIIQQGGPLAMLAPPAISTFEYDTVCLIADSPNPNAARLLLGWLLSRPGQGLVTLGGIYSIYDDIPPPANLPNIAGLDLKSANFATFAEQARQTREITVRYWP